jgi:uncharacterized surface protein with fasciclin (FAS1) repeats
VSTRQEDNQETTMKKLALTLCAAAILSACSGMNNTSGMNHMSGMSDMKPVMVGGAAMYPNKDIIDNAVNSKDHTTLVAAVKAAGLVDTLKSPGPFTVFAPVNSAFDALPAGTVATLLMPENKATLTKVLTYHVVPGRMNASDLSHAIMSGGGRATLTTVSGGTLVATMSGPNVIITDENGGSALVTIADVNQSNGVIHVINKVLLPR